MDMVRLKKLMTIFAVAIHKNRNIVGPTLGEIPSLLVLPTEE